jgi:hypothetical protein
LIPSSGMLKKHCLRFKLRSTLIPIYNGKLP